WNSFHGKKADGSATTNHYDWDDRIKTFYAATYQDNLYKVKGESFHITEDEAIKLLSRIIYELGRIKKADFAAKHGLTGADKTAIEAQLDRLIEQSTAIKEMNEKGATNPFNFNDLDFVAKLNDTLSGDAYTEEELADYGITVSDSSKTTLYKSTKKDADNQAKIKSSFSTTPNPVQQLFTDLRSQGAVDANFSTHYRLPESSDALDDLIAQLEADKTVSAVTNADLAKEIQELKKEIAEKESEIISKKSVLDGLVGEILTKKREKLNSYNIAKGFAKTSTEENRREVMELVNINQLLLTIRYLENDGDATSPST
ncbi:32453_t:CDS:2, partial [Racocetra persica]